jgi:hypothetical protein
MDWLPPQANENYIEERKQKEHEWIWRAVSEANLKVSPFGRLLRLAKTACDQQAGRYPEMRP